MDVVQSTSTLYFASFNFGALIVCLTCLVNMLLRRRFDKFQSKLFIAIIIDIGISATSDLVAELIRAFATGSAALWALRGAGFVYFVSHTAAAPLFFMYVLSVCRSTMRGNAIRRTLVALPFYLGELLVITNPLTNWVYSYGSDLSFTRHAGMYVIYAIGALYFVGGFLMLVRRWRALTPIKRKVLVYFFLMAGAGIVVQLLIPSLSIELFAESLAILGLLMFVESEEDAIDPESGVYNRYALEIDLDMATNVGRPYHVIAVRVGNIDALSVVGGSSKAAQYVSTTVVGYFKSLVPWYNIYRTTPTRFVLLGPDLSRAEASEIAHKIAERFKSGWSFGDVEVGLRAVVAIASYPEEVSKPEDVFYLVDTPAPRIDAGKVVEGEGLGYFMRRAEVERAIQRGLDEDGFEVYFQPIVRPDGVASGAEALMRLSDRVLGDVPPSEFIEVAERMGLVEQIGEIALKQTCELLSNGELRRLGIRHISVNLSVLQCMQPDFVARVNEIVSEHSVDPNELTFEITESVASSNLELLDRIMGELRMRGHRFAMDDYGTGYSNMHSLVELDFDIVKIDKSILWDAEESDVGMLVLRNSVSTMHDAGCQVLVEGVETESQVHILHRLGVDFYQGFYYAKPMPAREFMAYVKQHRV